MKQRNNKLNHTNTPSITNLLKRELPAEIKNLNNNIRTRDCMVPSPPPRDGGILILKTSNHWGGEMFSYVGGGGGVHTWGNSDNGNQRGHNSGQNNNHTVTFVSRKSNFYGHFRRTNSFHFHIISFKRKYVNCSLANFKRLASSHEKLYN